MAAPCFAKFLARIVRGPQRGLPAIGQLRTRVARRVAERKYLREKVFQALNMASRPSVGGGQGRGQQAGQLRIVADGNPAFGWSIGLSALAGSRCPVPT